MRDSIHILAAARDRLVREEYRLGLAFYRRKQWSAAGKHFATAQRRCGRDDRYRQLYMAYHGLCLVCGGDISGLNLCRRAASIEVLEATVFLNLALAELRRKHRKRAWAAVQLGLRFDPMHLGLQALRHKMGVRRPPCVSFLKRENPLNRWLGRYTWQRQQVPR